MNWQGKNFMAEVNKIKIGLLNIKKGERVLDLGCSFGEQAMMIARLGYKVVGVDLSKKRIGFLNRLSKKEKLDCNGIAGDIKKLPFKKNFFDCVVATEVLEHIPDPQKAIDEAFRVLKPGGKACVSVPTGISETVFRKMHPDWEKNSGHINVFGKKDISEMLENAGFKILRIENQNFEWSVFWLIHGFLKSKFDDTGTPSENLMVSKFQHKLWRLLENLRIWNILLGMGNKIFPKSIYLYLIKPKE